jgi:uncharacterized protein YbbK (DUF523 family)
LLGLKTRYDAKDNTDNKVAEFLEREDLQFYPLCTEQLGGLKTPREPSEIEKGYTAKDVLEGRAKIYTRSGKDVTKNYIDGAYQILKFCKKFGINKAILQQRSPSCGYGKVYDGCFSGNLKKGNGLLAQLLVDNGIDILSNEEL